MTSPKTELRPWLIQRATIESRPGRKGIDALLSFDYMGSAEFEFGALPKSLQRIRESLSRYGMADFRVPGTDKTVTIFCKQCDRMAVEELLPKLAREQVRLKEHSEFPEWVFPESRRYESRNNFWWDIDNDFMFWAKTDGFRSALQSALSQPTHGGEK